MRKFLMLLALVGFSSCIGDKPADRSDAHLPLGAKMPEFRVSGPSGEVSADDLQGKRTLVVFFRSTCPDCRRELPKVQAAWEAVGEQEDVRFVAVSKEDPDVVARYWDEAGYTMPRYRDADGAATKDFDVSYVPTLYLFDADGRVAFAAVETFGFGAEEVIEKIVEL